MAEIKAAKRNPFIIILLELDSFCGTGYSKAYKATHLFSYL
jgi:hypothetical protein